MFVVVWTNSIWANTSGDNLRQKVLSNAESFIGLSEATGKNDGDVCIFHRALGYKCGLAWCAMFGKYNYQKNGVLTKMDARAASIKNDPQATTLFEGGSYWYPTQYGTGHTGFVYAMDKKNSDKFVGLDGNYTDKVRFVQRTKEKHGKYFSNPYPDDEFVPIVKVHKKVKQDYVEQIPLKEEEAILIDSGIILKPRPVFRPVQVKIFIVLCILYLTSRITYAQFKRRHFKVGNKIITT